MEPFRKSASTKLVLRGIDPAKSVANVQPSTDESAPMQRSSRHSEPSRSTTKVEASSRPVRLQQPTASNPQCKYSVCWLFLFCYDLVHILTQWKRGKMNSYCFRWCRRKRVANCWGPICKYLEIRPVWCWRSFNYAMHSCSLLLYLT